MENRPTLTIAIPSYNKKDYIDRCIQSILIEKDYIEDIILVDNASTDGTFEAASKYEPKIKCFQNEKNLGMVGNWNKCIELCKTDWLMIFHADDELLPGSIKKYFEFMLKYPTVGMIYADANTVSEDVGVLPRSERSESEFKKAGLEAINLPHCVVCSTVMVKKNIYNHVGGFIESLSADPEMWARIGSKYDLGYINHPVVNYFINKTSTGLNSLTERSLMQIKKDWDNLTQRIAEHFPDEKSKKIYLKNSKDFLPYSYWSVFKANFRAEKYLKSLVVIFWIIFYCNGFFALVKNLTNAFKVKVLKRKKYDKSIA